MWTEIPPGARPGNGWDPAGRGQVRRRRRPTGLPRAARSRPGRAAKRGRAALEPVPQKVPLRISLSHGPRSHLKAAATLATLSLALDLKFRVP